MGRFYIATGTSIYHDRAPDLPTVETDVAAIQAALEVVGFTRAEVNPPLNPAGQELRDLEKWFAKRAPDDDVVLYYVGHGKSDDQHYLMLQDGEIASLDLICTFARNPIARRILLVLDTCESGNAALDLGQLWKGFEDRFASAGAQLTLVTSCRSNKEAQAGAFTPAFASALRHELTLPGRNSPRISISDLMDSLEPKLPSWQKTLVSSCPSTSNGRADFDFPNTASNPDVPEGIDLESQRRLVERQAHWDDRVRYFTGRARALTEIDAFLAGDKGGVVVVTGDPGSGKSAVLAHYALSKSVDFSIHAKGRDLAKMMQIVSDATKVSLPGPAAGDEDNRAKALAQSLGASGKPWAIVIDALDEALRPAETTRSLLAGLAKCPNIRLLLGTRPDTIQRGGQRFQGLGSATTEIDLDSDRYFAPDEIETYARTRLRETGPYAGNQALARDAAAAVARKSARTYLIAKLECDGLVRLPEPLMPALIWDSPLPSDVKAAFSEYLDRFPDEGLRRQVYLVLQPLAFTFGQGLPSAIWEQMAQALSGEPVTVARIREVVDRAGAYVVESVEDGSSVYRLFHQQFAEYFWSRSDVGDCHSRITTALLPRNWLQAPQYTRRYLAMHAAEGHRLDELLEIPAFLVVADPGTLTRVIGGATSDNAVRNASVYSVAAHLLETSVAERAASLALAAIKFGFRELADDLKAFGGTSPWWPRAAQWQISPHFVIRGVSSAMRTVAVGVRGGRTVIAAGGDDGFIRLWDRETLEPVGSPLRTHASSYLVITISVGPKPQLLATDRDGVILAWDLETLAPAIFSQHGLIVLRWSTAGGRTFAICETADRKIEIRGVEHWDLLRAPFSPPWDAGSGWLVAQRQGGLAVVGFNYSEVHAFDLNTLVPLGLFKETACHTVATGLYAGTPVVVTGTVYGTVNLWSCETFERLAGPLYGHQTYVDGVTVGEWRGVSFIVSASRDESVRVWPQPVQSETKPGVPTGVSDVSKLATGVRHGKPAVITGGWEEPVRVWDMETLEPLGSSNGRDSSAVAVGERHGRLIALVGEKESLRILDLETFEYSNETPAGKVVGFSGYGISASTIGKRQGQSVVISSTQGGVIVVRDLEKWSMIGKPIEVKGARPGRSLTVASLVPAEDQGVSVLLSAGFDRVIRVWDLDSMKESGPPMVGHESAIYNLAVSQYQPGPTLLASVSFDQTVRLWDLQSRSQSGSPLRGHTAQVHGVAFTKWRFRLVVVSGSMDGTIRIWDVETHAQLAVINVDSRVFQVEVWNNLIIAGCARGLATIELR